MSDDLNRQAQAKDQSWTTRVAYVASVKQFLDHACGMMGGSALSQKYVVTNICGAIGPRAHAQNTSGRGV